VSAIRFCPIDIPTPQLNQELLLKFVSEYGRLHYTGLWTEVPIIGYVSNDSDWHVESLRDRAWLSRYKAPQNIGSNPKWHSGFFGADLDCLKDFLEKLPFHFITHCNILMQQKFVPSHYDIDRRYEKDALLKRRDLEPASYKWLLSPHQTQSFFIEDLTQFRHFPQFPKNYECFVISESSCRHGAVLPPSSKKLMLSIFGILDEKKHFEILSRSAVKFKDYIL
jgi:hypothetical protein